MTESIFYIQDDSKMYVEKILPDKFLSNSPIVLVHGGACSGACFKSTPDGRKGWAYNFADRGYEVYNIDWPGIGRSGYLPINKINGELIVKALSDLINQINKKVIVLTHSMSGAYGWKLGEVVGDKISAIVAIEPAPPGNIQSAPKVVEESAKAIKANHFGINYFVEYNKAAFYGDDFIDKKMIGTDKYFPTNHKEQFVSSMQPIMPILLKERLNINNTQLKIDDFLAFKKFKILIITGSESIDHSKEVDKKIVDFFIENDANAEQIYLPDEGIVGNGHMMMSATNSSDISDLIVNWIDKENNARG